MATGDKALASRFNAIITNINTVKAYNTSYVPSGQTWQGTVTAGTKMTAANVNRLIANVIALSDKVESVVGDGSACTTNNCSGNHSGYTASSNSHKSSCSCNGRCDSNQTYCPSAH